MFNKFCLWLDSNRRPLVLEVTALPTEAQPLPFSHMFVVKIVMMFAWKDENKKQRNIIEKSIEIEDSH